MKNLGYTINPCFSHLILFLSIPPWCFISVVWVYLPAHVHVCECLHVCMCILFCDCGETIISFDKFLFFYCSDSIMHWHDKVLVSKLLHWKLSAFGKWLLMEEPVIKISVCKILWEVAIIADHPICHNQPDIFVVCAWFVLWVCACVLASLLRHGQPPVGDLLAMTAVTYYTGVHKFY